MPREATAWELAQALPFPPPPAPDPTDADGSSPKSKTWAHQFPSPQSPAEIGLSGANPKSNYYGQPYPDATLELEAPYCLRRCRMALREIAECWQVLVEFHLRNPGFSAPGYAISATEARVYQRITERYVQFADAGNAGGSGNAEGPHQ